MANGKPPLPPQAVAGLCRLVEDGPKDENGIPVLTLEQVLGAFCAMIPSTDNKEIFEEKVISNVRESVKRIRHQKKVFPELQGPLTELHTKVEGDANKLHAWFMDLLPEGAGFPKEQFMIVICRTPPTESKIALEAFLSGIETNMDESDTVEKINGCIKKHMA
eukprot:CAMPEP_0184296882 /NCGR_PEP_ID=MMETSP1049-20130417/7829_1 /TAXON_ID=77928 /ORGANISM="Proteomonas sulcata, Strain CCMP704" /LENGTH=162 /DNA_ID=CAMNT_0026606333 /DNA_START=63 /DNA_END=551 /DNA_ORIENTATION=+